MVKEKENVIVEEKKDSVTAVKVKKVEEEEVVKLAYIGPSLPAGRLKCNRIFIGTVTEIKKELTSILEKYPLVEKLLVPVSEMGEKKERVRNSGNIFHKYYSDLASIIAAD